MASPQNQGGEDSTTQGGAHKPGSTKPVAHDEALNDFDIAEFIGPILIGQIHRRNTARLQLATKKGLKISDLRMDKDSCLITWDGIKQDIAAHNLCLPAVENENPVEPEEGDIDPLLLDGLKASLARLRPARAEVWDRLSMALEAGPLTKPLLYTYWEPVVQQVATPLTTLDRALSWHNWVTGHDDLAAHLKTVPSMMCRLCGVKAPLAVNDDAWAAWWFGAGREQMRQRSVAIAGPLSLFAVPNVFLNDNSRGMIEPWLADPAILQQIQAQKALRACLEPNPRSGQASPRLA